MFGLLSNMKIVLQHLILTLVVKTNARQKTKQENSRTSPEIKFKKFSLTEQKIRPGMNWEKMEKPFRSIR